VGKGNQGGTERSKTGVTDLSAAGQEKYRRRGKGKGKKGDRGLCRGKKTKLGKKKKGGAFAL